jgi:hypothetical protein
MLNLWIKFALQDENSTLNIYFLKYIIVIVTDISNKFFNLTTFIHTIIFGRGPINKGQGTGDRESIIVVNNIINSDTFLI